MTTGRSNLFGLVRQDNAKSPAIPQKWNSSFSQRWLGDLMNRNVRIDL
jgi:hypothetical protein